MSNEESVYDLLNEDEEADAWWEGLATEEYMTDDQRQRLIAAAKRGLDANRKDRIGALERIALCAAYVLEADDAGHPRHNPLAHLRSALIDYAKRFGPLPDEGGIER
ncbi:MAG TPA: hypothetical protein VM782_01270 [Stellaceae bacterium]|nr:hypothetical protein [Stellaceae bacterium]